ncbi:WXG100 family type VII secretion target [Nocardia panacis]|uniref:WXG100 family type VII secretion target n=1 Tax=Nocardia panacis TaxID=2340916 RepID=A0A3A4KM54_9NOCA|nr:WXG100 family type VII secretion target [Nocardia panacis]RJO76638.1 WXG100 family type VII secretion target [Nocardia panacis]
MSGDDVVYRVDLEHLDQVTAKVAGLLGFLDESLQGIDTRVRALHSEWSGASAAMHVQAHQDWAKGVAEIRAGVDAMHEAARTAHAHYSDVCAMNMKVFGR